MPSQRARNDRSSIEALGVGPPTQTPTRSDERTAHPAAHVCRLDEVDAALRSSGKAGDIALILGEGDPAVMSGLQDGKIKGTGIGIPEDWEGYSSIDNLNRLFAGEEPAGSGIGLQAFDADNNVPDSGGYAAPIDFRQAYEDAWSGGE